MGRLSALAPCAILIGFCLAWPAAADEKSNTRAATDGPLTKDDYLAKLPDPRPTFEGRPLRAWTSGDVQNRYRYRFSIEAGKYRLTPTEIDVFAVVFRDKSWNIAPGDADLLDHEQGHVDLATIYALRARAVVRRMLARGELTVTAKDEATAKKEFEKRLKKTLDDELAALSEENRRYDRETRHGGDRERQREHRAHHARLLRELKAAAEEKKKR
jgi:hypothetical protein